LDSQDLIDCLQYKYRKRNWGFDTIRWLIPYLAQTFEFDDVSYLYNVFQGIGTCKCEKLTTSMDIEQFLDYYLVWYKPNNDGQSGPNIEGSTNHRFGEYVATVLKGSADNMNQIRPIIESLGSGLDNNIDIVVALDTSINKGLVVDGTKRSLALYYLKNKERGNFISLLASKHSINIITLKSSITRILFPVDFCKLCD
jgi:hypothetical protein